MLSLVHTFKRKEATRKVLTHQLQPDTQKYIPHVPNVENWNIVIRPNE
jgi:hypothetical protein